MDTVIVVVFRDAGDATPLSAIPSFRLDATIPDANRRQHAREQV